MTPSQPNTKTKANTLNVPYNIHIKSRNKINSNGGAIIKIPQSKKSKRNNNLYGILMKMHSKTKKTVTEADFVRKCFRESHKNSPNTLMKIHIFLLITLLICVSMCMTRASAHTMKYSSNVVKTKYGELRGIVVRNNPTVEAYLGKYLLVFLFRNLFDKCQKYTHIIQSNRCALCNTSGW